MKLNSTATCVSLVLRALDKSVAPAASTPEAANALQLIRTTLLDLLKRQDVSVTALRDSISAGEALDEECNHYLTRLEAESEPQKNGTVTTKANFDQLAESYDELTTRLNRQAKRLSAITKGDPSAVKLLRRIAEWEMKYYVDIMALRVAPFGDDPAVDPPVFDTSAQPLTAIFLQDFLVKRRGHPLEVILFEPVTGGFGKRTYRSIIKHSAVEGGSNVVLANGDSHLEELIIRMADPAPIMLHSTFRIENEFDLLCSLSKTAFPCPHPIDLACDLPDVDGDFYTMGLLRGAIPRPFLDGGGKQDVSEDILFQLAEHLANLHALPLSTFATYLEKYEDSSALTETVGQRYARNLRGWREYVERVEHMPSPYVTWLFDWMERHIPDDKRRPVLSHGDFALHNVLVADNRITGILDWECADFGAPEQDLAYVKPHIVKHMEWERWLGHYVASGGEAVNLEIMPFCAAYGVLRTFLGGVMGSQNIQRGHNRDLRYVMVEYGFGPMFMQMGLGAAKEL